LIALTCALLVAAPAAAEVDVRVLVDAPVTVSTSASSVDSETELLLWPGLRGGAQVSFGRLVLGADATVAGTFATAGTPIVSVTRALGGLELRGLVGTRWGGPLIDVTPYGWASGLAALGPAFVHAGASDEVRWLFVPSARAGAGATVRLGYAHVRLDVGAGWLADRPEIVGVLALGSTF
jgi:hypothetical protein